MKIIEKRGVWRLLDKCVTLIITDDKQLETIINNPAQPLFDFDDR